MHVFNHVTYTLFTSPPRNAENVILATFCSDYLNRNAMEISLAIFPK